MPSCSKSFNQAVGTRERAWGEIVPPLRHLHPDTPPLPTPTKRPLPHRDGRLEGKGKVDGRREKGRELSRDDLVFLLSLLEGELQARDEVITLLKADRIEVASLEAHYGFAFPEEALRALQRDSLQVQACGAQGQQAQQQDVYEKPMTELDLLVEAQRRGSRRMLEQLLEVERSHSDALCRLEEQERNHRAFIQRSDDLTSLLEQDRERLKLLLVQEKALQERREEESQGEVSALQEELAKLKSFALLVVDEQLHLTNQLTEQSQQVQLLTNITDHAQQELDSTHSRVREEELKVLHLEAELRDFHLNQEAMTAKLANEDAQNQQLRQRLVTLGHQLDELEGTRGKLRRAEEELQEMRDRVSRRGGEDMGEVTSPGLLSEVEQLRRRVVEMEGKDGEMVRLEDQCRDLDHRLGRESSQGRSLKVEVEKLNGRISELDKLEEALGRSRQEGSALRSNLEKEKATTKQLSEELEVLRLRVKELEAIECQLERCEGTLRQDLTKLRTLTMVLVEDRKVMAEKLRQTEHKLQQGKGRAQTGQNNVSPATEKLIEERERALRSKAELEERYQSMEKERDELGARLRTEEENSGNLQSKVNSMRRRLEILEKKDRMKERYMEKDEGMNINQKYQEEDNKVRELSQEVERLRGRLMQKEVVEGELMKAEEEYESLERRCCEEQERCQALREQLEESRMELSRYQLTEKRMEEPNQEHILLRRLQEEQVKSRLLSREVEALREKIQRLMGTEESINQVQINHTTLQRKLAQQEVRNRELAREMESLTQELERYRRFSKSLRPGMNGRRFADLHQSTKEVQTEPEEAYYLPPDYQTLVPMVVNGNLPEEDEKEDLNHNKEQVVLTKVSPSTNLSMQNNNQRRSSIPLANRRGTHQSPSNGEVLNTNLVKKGDLVLTHNPGQPLHIKVTPDHSHNTATLEITSPTVDNTASYTSTAVIPTSGAPPKQRITIIKNSSMSPPKVKSGSSPSPDGVFCSDRAISPLSLTSLSRVTTPNSFRSKSPDPTGSPVQIVTVSTGTPEPTEVIGQAIFQVTPERKQNGWHLQKSNGAGPSIITTEDNKIHIHLGNPYIQALNGIAHVASQPGRQYHSPGQETRELKTQVPQEALQKPGHTQIPKPKSYGTLKGTNGTCNTVLGKGKPATILQSAKNSGLRVRNKTNITTSTTC